MAAEFGELASGSPEETKAEKSETNGHAEPPKSKEKVRKKATKPENNGDSPKKKKTKRAPKRKKPATGDTTDDENENDSGETTTTGKKKKKTKKKQPSKKTFERRNIKAVFSEDKLEESTKNALAEEQQRLMRLQQAQRDAFANDVLRDFDLKKLTKIEPGDEEEEIPEDGTKLEPFEEDTKEEEEEEEAKGDDFIELSSDEERAAPKKEEVHSDSSDIQILSDVEEVDEDDPDNSGMHTNDRLNSRTKDGKVVINVSEKNPEVVVHVAESIEKIIKPHQIGGVRFLYDNIIESPSTYDKSSGFGCILAHAMGLGKTLQVVTFSDVFLRATSGKYVLIIVPINTLQNWYGEFKQWLPHEPFKVHLVSDSLKTITQRATVISKWKDEGGVLLMGYELFRLLAGTKAQQRKKKSKAKKKPECVDIEEEDREKDIMVGKLNNWPYLAHLKACFVFCFLKFRRSENAG